MTKDAPHLDIAAPTKLPRDHRCVARCDAACDGNLVHCRMTRAVAGQLNIQAADRIYQSNRLLKSMEQSPERSFN